MNPPKSPPPSKKEVALALLEQTSLFIHLDPRKPEVAVPQWFKAQPQLVLQVGLNMPVPIPDLDVDDDGVTCTLSFNRSPHWCKLPWSAIYALVGEDGGAMVWPADVPPEVAAQLERSAPKKPALTAVASPAKGKSRPARKKRAPAKSKATPSLQSVPSPSEPAAKAPAPLPIPAPAERRPATPSPTPSGAKKSTKKRELPPYLRVVK